MNYVALGDSITAFREDVKVYYELLQESKDLPFTELINSAVRGWKSSDLLAHLEDKCLRYEPDLVTLMLGSNDHAIYKGETEPSVSLEAYEANLVEIVNRIRVNHIEKGGTNKLGPAIILMTPPFAATHINIAGTDVSQRRLMPYCNKVKEISSELQTGLVDINFITGQGTNWDDQLYCDTFTHDQDGVHLNSSGHRLIFPHIIKAIRVHLEERKRE